MKLPTNEEVISAYERFKKQGIQSNVIGTNYQNLFLKSEHLLPGSSYKMRGVLEYFENAKVSEKSIKVLSAGNLALATAIEASRHKIPCHAIVPVGISEIKKNRLQQHGAEVLEIPFDELWDLVNMQPEQLGSKYLHPLNVHLLCGYATMALEVKNQLPALDALVVPYGLGGLTLALALGCAISGAKTKLYVAEIEGHSPLKLSLEEGRPMTSPKLQSFIEALGTPGVLPTVFESLKIYSPEVILVSEEETKDGIRELYNLDCSLRVEGAAAAAFVAAKKITSNHSSPVTAILTGGNISETIFDQIAGN